MAYKNLEDAQRYHQEWYKKHRERLKLQQQEYYKQNKVKKKESVDRYRGRPEIKAKLLIAQKAWLERNPEKRRLYSYRNCLKKYGLTFEQYEQLLKDQNNNCALCGKPFSTDTRSTHVDHCHRTNKVRGVVHRACNVILGYSMENIDILQRAIEYLKKHIDN
jgi:hypothetical protein